MGGERLRPAFPTDPSPRPTMTDEPGFLAQLYHHPHDDVTRLVYADWLDERGDARADYLRREVDLAAVDEWSPDVRDREAALRRATAGIDAHWLDLVGKRYDVHVVDLPDALWRVIGTRYFQVPFLLARNCLRPQAEAMRERLLPDNPDEPAAGNAVGIKLRPAETPQPQVTRFPGPVEPPGYALRLVKLPVVGRGQLVDAIAAVQDVGVGDAMRVLEGDLPRTLRTYPTPEAARRAARLFHRLHAVEVRHIEPPPRGRILDRPLTPTYAVVLHRYPERVKKQLIGTLRLMLNCTPAKARQLAASPLPWVVQSGLDWESAEALRQALPALAAVEVVEAAAT